MRATSGRKSMTLPLRKREEVRGEAGEGAVRGGKEDLHFSSWHNLIRKVVGHDDRSKFQSGNDNLVEY